MLRVAEHTTWCQEHDSPELCRVRSALRAQCRLTLCWIWVTWMWFCAGSSQGRRLHLSADMWLLGDPCRSLGTAGVFVEHGGPTSAAPRARGRRSWVGSEVSSLSFAQVYTGSSGYLVPGLQNNHSFPRFIGLLKNFQTFP